MTIRIETPRLHLRSLSADDLGDFTTLHANPQSMVDYGRPDTLEQATAKLLGYLNCQVTHGVSRLHVSDSTGFIGCAGVFCHADKGPIGPHAEVGWRLLPQAWGKGYASEAARAALIHAFRVTRLTEILSYTAPDNLRSQAVMARLGLTRDATRDFSFVNADVGLWRGMVWLARRSDWTDQAGLGGIE